MRRFQCWQSTFAGDCTATLINICDQDSKSALSKAGKDKLRSAEASGGFGKTRNRWTSKAIIHRFPKGPSPRYRLCCKLIGGQSKIIPAIQTASRRSTTNIRASFLHDPDQIAVAIGEDKGGGRPDGVRNA